jgi:3,4-dihydroxy 2-butanone 4-phosphate synthase/GTP cyclohydrolase II
MISKIEDILKDIKALKPVIIVDDEDRENEGDLIIPAENITPEIINFMISHCKGLVCVPITKERAEQIDLSPMVKNNSDNFDTAFTVSVDAHSRFGVTTGISPADRAETIKKLIDPRVTKADFSKPGHIFPLISKDGGVLVRSGHTEASVDLARLAGYSPAGVICEIINEDGQMSRLADLENFAKNHDLKIGTIKDLIAYRINNETFIDRGPSVNLPTKFGEFTVTSYHDQIENKTHISLVKGDVKNKKDVLVRVHSECFTGDVLSSLRCDCQNQLHKAMDAISKKGEGVIIYMRQEGRGIGLINKLKAYNLQDKGADTVEANEKLGFPADLRDYGIGAQILKNLGLTSIHLLTNNPRKIIGLEGYGLTVTKRVALDGEENKHNIHYLKTKKKKLGHIL